MHIGLVTYAPMARGLSHDSSNPLDDSPPVAGEKQFVQLSGFMSCKECQITGNPRFLLKQRLQELGLIAGTDRLVEALNVFSDIGKVL